MLQRRYTPPNIAGRTKTGGRATVLPALEAWRTMEQVPHADTVPTQPRRTPQPATAKEIYPSARLSHMPAQLLRNNRIEHPRLADNRIVVISPV
jgi:hypothetical protein